MATNWGERWSSCSAAAWVSKRRMPLLIKAAVVPWPAARMKMHKPRASSFVNKPTSLEVARAVTPSTARRPSPA